MTRRHIVGAVLTHIVAFTALQAQVPASPAATQRAEIQQAVRAYIDAHNRSDAATIADMYSRQPGVTSVGDGQIMRGWDRIREAFDQLVGTQGRFKIDIGSIDVVPLGPGYALALTSYSLSIGTGAETTQQRGAMTLVFQKQEGEWKVVHDHTSTQAPENGAATSASVAQNPTPQVQAAAVSPTPTGKASPSTDSQAGAELAQHIIPYTAQYPAPSFSTYS